MAKAPAKRRPSKIVKAARTKLAKARASKVVESNVGGDSAKASKKKTMGEPELLNEGGSEKRSVCIFYTGGTMGMMDIGNGSLGPVAGALAKRLRLVEELDSTKMPRCYLVEFDPIIDSSDMSPLDWTFIAQAIFDEYLQYDGFVVIHGTDTMAYTASVLSFMLENLSKPIVVTGSQLPFFETLSDARQNFLGAVVFAGLADISEVGLFFNGQLMRGNRTNKCHSAMLNAFISPKYPPLAEVGTDLHVYRRRLRDPPRGRFRLQTIAELPIMVVWVIPGFSDSVFHSLLKHKIKGLILMLYGCGNAPARRQSFLDCLERLVKQGVVIVACSQCLRGAVSLEKHGVGKAFEDRGIVSAGDMTTEATVTKLYYLLSKGLSPQEVRQQMVEDLSGELTTQSTAEKIREPVISLSVVK